MKDISAAKYKPYLLGIWTLLIVGYVRAEAPILWQAEWSHDDLMNAYRAMTNSWGELLRQTVLFWQPTPIFRPLGELFYKFFWEQFGFATLPWRLACSALLIGNAFVLGHIATRISGSLGAGLMATALASYHPLWTHLYLNTGTIFEILACTFVLCGVAWYTEFHEPWIPTLLLIAGLNAKESAVVLPALIVIYEWIWNRRLPRLYIGLSVLVCLAFILGRVNGEGGLSTTSGYEPTYNLSTYLTRLQEYFGAMVVFPGAPSLLLLVPLVLRNRLAVFAVLWFPVAMLPLAFVPNRGLEGVYIACMALPMAAAAGVMRIQRENYRIAAAFISLGLLFLFVPPQLSADHWSKEYTEIRQFREDLQREMPQMPPSVQIRFVSEPFSEDYPWASTFLTKLVYRDPSLQIVSPNNPHTRNYPESADFVRFGWRDGHLYRLK